MQWFPEGHEEQVKEIYARFGLVIYQVQCLEHGLVNALVVLDLIPNERHKARSKPEWESLVDSFMGTKFELTLGKLIKALAVAAVVPDDLGKNLASALKLRNYLVHHYFRERSEAMLNVSGRRGMFDELVEWHSKLSKVDDELSLIVSPAASRMGITPDVEGRLFKEFLERAGYDIQ